MIQKRVRILFLSLIFAFFLTSGGVIFLSYKEKAGLFSSSFKKEIENWWKQQRSKNLPSPVPSPTPSFTPTPSPTVLSPLKPKTYSPKPKTKACYRYRVVHLDGSSSYLCYNKEDYDQLVNLGYQLSSAKTFYQFHLDGAAKYQEEYERTGSDIYLQAKESSLRSAEREKEKINQITLQMQEIEKRGFNQ